jgi:hypothetical protein
VELALSIAERRGDAEVFCQAINTKGLMLGGQGRREEGRALIRCALDRALAADLHESALRAYNNLAADLQASGPAQASTYIKAGRALSRLMGRRRLETMLTIGEIPNLIELGRWDDAMGVVADFLETGEQWVTESELGSEVTYGVWVHLWRGEIAEARRLIERMTDLNLRSSPEANLVHNAASAAVLRASGRESEALAVMSNAVQRTTESADFLDITRWITIETIEAAFATGDYQMVHRELETLTRRLSPAVSPILHGHVQRFEARLAALEHRDDEVVRHANGAIDAFQQRQIPFWLAVSRLELGEWMAQESNTEARDKLVAEARQTFMELGAVPWIERADASAQGGGATSADTALPA